MPRILPIQYFCNTKIDCTETGKHTVATAIIYIRYRIIPRRFIVRDETRDYFYPIPTDDRSLTGGALTQNPGWNDGLNF